MNNQRPWLRRFAKLTSFSTLFLIFVGSLVTSTGSGLSVPDWPLSYGSLFPPMVGGVFYEHSHRMVASFVGFLMLILAVWLGRKEERCWVKNLGFAALGAVIAQGILGGITVKFFLPPAVSVGHAVLAQTFFILTIIIAYSQSLERKARQKEESTTSAGVLRIALVFTTVVYLQLIIGAWMRHTNSGLAIPDFPTMGGYWLPPFNQLMLTKINAWRFAANLDPVTMSQVYIHFLHRLGAFVILVILILLNGRILTTKNISKNIRYTLYVLDILIAVQITLGILTVLSMKQPFITSFHVLTGASILGMSVLFFLRACPLKWNELKTKLFP